MEQIVVRHVQSVLTCGTDQKRTILCSGREQSFIIEVWDAKSPINCLLSINMRNNNDSNEAQKEKLRHLNKTLVYLRAAVSQKVLRNHILDDVHHPGRENKQIKFFSNAVLKFFTDSTVGRNEELWRTMLVTLFGKLISLRAFVPAIGRPLRRVMHCTSRRASTHERSAALLRPHSAWSRCFSSRRTTDAASLIRQGKLDEALSRASERIAVALFVTKNVPLQWSNPYARRDCATERLCAAHMLCSGISQSSIKLILSSRSRWKYQLTSNFSSDQTFL